MPTIKVEGLKKLSKELKAIDKNLPKELNKVGKEAAEVVAVETRSTAPRRTGRLAGSVKAGARQSGAFVRTGGNVPYAKVIVYGWAGHNIEPNPFPYEAADTRRDEVIERFSKGVHDLVEKSITPGTGEG